MLLGCYTDHLLFTIVRKLRVFTIKLYKKAEGNCESSSDSRYSSLLRILTLYLEIKDGKQVKKISIWNTVEWNISKLIFDHPRIELVLFILRNCSVMAHRDQSYLRVSLISLNLLKDIIIYFFNIFIYVTRTVYL